MNPGITHRSRAAWLVDKHDPKCDLPFGELSRLSRFFFFFRLAGGLKHLTSSLSCIEAVENACPPGALGLKLTHCCALYVCVCVCVSRTDFAMPYSK